jgi:hypothetical protein
MRVVDLINALSRFPGDRLVECAGELTVDGLVIATAEGCATFDRGTKGAEGVHGAPGREAEAEAEGHSK